MAFTTDDLDRLYRAVAQGVLTVTFADGRSVTFSSFDEIQQRITFIKRELGMETGRQRLLSEYKKGVSP